MPVLNHTAEPGVEPIVARVPHHWPASLMSTLAWPRTVWREAASQPTRRALVLAFIGVWTIELFLVQRATLIPPQAIGPRLAVFGPMFRLVLDFGLISIITLLLSRRMLAFASLFAFVLHVALLTFYHYFQRPLSLLTLRNNWNEGVEATSLGLQVIPSSVWWWIGSALAIKLALLALAKGPGISRGTRWKLSGTIAVCYCVLTIICNQLDPLERILTTRGIARLGLIRGYSEVWIAEEYYLGDAQILERAIAERQFKLDRLNPIESPFSPGKRVIVIQAESLDFSALGYKVKGEEVTPFLNRLRDQSMFYRIQAMHFNGSADADFTALNGVRPSRHVMNYNIPEYPYQDTLPQFLTERDFHTVALHGNVGHFYKRRRAYRKMGFDNLLFEEDLVEQFRVPSAEDIGVLDEHVFDISRQLLKTTQGPVFHFIITLTSHTPFNLLPAAKQELFPGTSSYGERYLNSIRYVDRVLQNYIETLPVDTTVMIYGDHAAGVDWENYHSDRDAHRDFVPCFFFKKGHDLSQVQATRDQPIATDGSLTLLDMIAYLRTQIANETARRSLAEPSGSE